MGFCDLTGGCDGTSEGSCPGGAGAVGAVGGGVWVLAGVARVCVTVGLSPGVSAVVVESVARAGGAESEDMTMERASGSWTRGVRRGG